MQTRTIIDKIEIEPQTGNVGVRIRKQVIDETKTDPSTGDKLVLASEYHRTMIGAGADQATQMAAVNAHLATMGFPAVKAEDHAALNAVIAPLASLRSTKAAEQVAKGPK